mmetsp:Transcript_48276/g.103521  ORF Transcript_48276/g.103521 Transcript_48276/m.103521 type:complete len:213 (-) Transcript_48276:560-1198(-)
MRGAASSWRAQEKILLRRAMPRRPMRPEMACCSPTTPSANGPPAAGVRMWEANGQWTMRLRSWCPGTCAGLWRPPSRRRRQEPQQRPGPGLKVVTSPLQLMLAARCAQPAPLPPQRQRRRSSSKAGPVLALLPPLAPPQRHHAAPKRDTRASSQRMSRHRRWRARRLRFLTGAPAPLSWQATTTCRTRRWRRVSIGSSGTRRYGSRPWLVLR